MVGLRIAPPTPRRVVVAAIVVQAATGLALGLPGHLSVDSIMQLYEGRTLQFISHQPPMMSLLLRVLDGWVTGTALFVVLDQLLLTASFALLLAARRDALRWLPAALAVPVILNPVLIAYTGIVWKDVLMAHLAALGSVCLYLAAQRPANGARIGWAAVAVLALALAASLRQHALVLALPGAVYAAMLLAGGAARWGLAAALSLAVVGINVAIVGYADAITVGERFPRAEAGFRSLATFDVVGIAANGGVIVDEAIAAAVATRLVPLYTPAQFDMASASAAGSVLGQPETSKLIGLWGRSILESPLAYLSHRAAHLTSVVARPCFPMFAGVEPTAYIPSLGRDINPELGVKGRLDRRDRKLLAWADKLHRATPLFSHVFWLAVVIAAAVALQRRGATALVVFAVSAVFFALGFGVIGISCDFRYLYVLPVAATLSLLALLLAPPRAAN